MEMKFVALVVSVMLVIAGVCFFSIYSSSNDRSFVKAFATSIGGRVPLTVSFSCEYHGSYGEVKQFLWDFGDGNTSENRSTTHTYQKSGYYQVELTMWNDRNVTMNDRIYVTELDMHPPFVSISADDTCGKAPFTVSFSSNAYDIDGEIVSYEWDFGEGSTSSEKEVTHTYTETGRYYARLTVTDNDGMKHSDSLQITVIENYVPIAIASSDVTNGKAPLLVHFYGDSIDIDGEKITYQWVIEGTILAKNRESNQQNMAHRFWLPGNYDVTLTVTDEDGATDSSAIRITVQESIFSWVLQLTIKNIISRVIDTSSNSIGDWIGAFIANRLF
ncbi:MAG: PKD domain-containing protein [Candidatus Thermoplasmatota archaeon]|nr:PKD domain-containing protein [Candidatus Thermoplasmatota archaeon]